MRMHYFTVAGLTTVGFSTEDDAGVEQSALTTVGVTETLPGRYTVDVTEGLTVNWYEGATFSVSERAVKPLPAASYTAPDNTTVTTIRKVLTNKTVESSPGDSVTLYDDDGTTPLGTWSWAANTKTRGKLT